MGNLSPLGVALGKRVSKVRYGRYRGPEGSVDEGGFVEITFESGDALVLDTASDWSLAVSLGPWTDWTAAPLSEENSAFVETHGQWTAVDVSNGQAAPLVGSVIESTPLLHDETGDAVGVRIITDRAVLHAVQQDGELAVCIERR